LVDLEWEIENGRPLSKEKEGTTRIIPCELAFIAIGFMYPDPRGMIQQLNLALDQKGNVQTSHPSSFATVKDKIFVAGDMRRGQSLVVWAISEGREAARQVDRYLMGKSSLENKDESIWQEGT
jgi:glutamate synthase (NADPH) small chain